MPGIQRMSHLFEIMPLFKICDRYTVVLYSEPFWHVCMDGFSYGAIHLTSVVQVNSGRAKLRGSQRESTTVK
jgi:hypothetical protein